MQSPAATWIITAIVSCEALLLAVFGSMYGVYVTYKAQQLAPLIIPKIRLLCLALVYMIILAAVLAIWSLWSAWKSLQLPTALGFGLTLLIMSLPTFAAYIRFTMHK